MLSRIVDIRTPESVRATCFNKVRHFLYDLTCDYPFFEEWLEHVFVMTYTKERVIITCESDDGIEIYGVCIIKNTKQEKKICTLRVAAEIQRQGIGTHLVSMAIALLGDDYPLITVPQKHLEPFKRFLSFFNFKISGRVKSVYNEDTYELVGKSTGRRYCLGSRIRVICNMVDIETRAVDFVIADENDYHL